VRLVPESMAVSDLIDDVDKGELALPEFQRRFLWRPPAVADLLRTVARKWPCGTFVLLAVEDKPDFALKPLEGAPKATNPRVLILDGQQRSTALYQSMTEKAEETYYIEMGVVRESGEFEDEHLKYLKNSRFTRLYPNVQSLAKDRVVKVAMLSSDRQFNGWLRYIEDEAEQDELLGIREDLLSGLREYEIPAIRLPHDVPLPAIAKIFETLNRTGVRLATFDLMVARLYPYDFRLRDKWDDARATHDVFGEYGYDIDEGIEILKVIALREHMRQRESGVKMTVKGVRESDVLTLSAELVIASWDVAVQAYVAAMEFIKERCGAIRAGLIPSSTVLLPLSDLLAPDRPQRGDLNDDLERWFWATSFSQTYSQGANTQAVADARALRAWQADGGAAPDVVRNFRVDAELLKDGRRRNEMLLRGFLCWSVTQNARDWIENERFQDLPGKLEVHHVFSDEYLDKHYKGDKDPVANFVLLTEATNKKLRNTLPKDVLVRPDVHREAIASHPGIDVSTLEETPEVQGKPSEYIRRFLESRAPALEEIAYKAVGIPKPE
jgi:hypothetical protein